MGELLIGSVIVLFGILLVAVAVSGLNNAGVTQLDKLKIKMCENHGLEYGMSMYGGYGFICYNSSNHAASFFKSDDVNKNLTR